MIKPRYFTTGQTRIKSERRRKELSEKCVESVSGRDRLTNEEVGEGCGVEVHVVLRWVCYRKD